MSLRHALLGMLAYQPASGYDLTKAFERELGTYAWQAGHTRIYPELNRLAEDGLIVVAEEGPRGRRGYAVTEAGRQELRDWLFADEPETAVRNTGVLRLFLMSALDSADTRELLNRIVVESERETAALRSAVDELDEASRSDDRPAFGRLAAEYGLRMHAARRDWALWALDRTP